MADVDTVLGVDIGTTAIKAAQLIKGANGYAADLLAVEPVHLPPPDEEGNVPDPLPEIEQSLRQLVERNGLKGARCSLSLSGEDVAPRYFAFPPMESDEQVAQAVRFEAAEIIPFDISECLMDHQVFPRDPAYEGEPRTEGVVVAARTHAINARYDMAKRIGLTPVIMDVDGMALANCFIESGGGAPPEKPTLVLNIGHHKTNLAVITTNGRAYIRDIPTGGARLTHAVAELYKVDAAEAEMLKAGPVMGEPNTHENLHKLQPDLRTILGDGMGELLNQVRDSVTFFLNQRFFGNIDEVWVTGGAANFPGLPEYIGETFGVPATGWNPLADIALNKVEEGRNPARADALGPRFAVALGLAMRPDVE